MAHEDERHSDPEAEQDGPTAVGSNTPDRAHDGKEQGQDQQGPLDSFIREEVESQYRQNAQ
jgi:hypothetical protein